MLLVIHKRRASDTALSHRTGWPIVIRRYLVAAALGNVVWEFAQLPLYTVWHTGTAGEIAFAALQCAAGDLGIAAAALAVALALFDSPDWPDSRFATVLVAVVILGTGYAAYSEHLNTAVRHAWAYSALMPIVPGLRIALAPLAQWLVIPVVSLAWARRQPIQRLGSWSEPE